MPQSQSQPAAPDALTLASVGMLAYVLAALFHEGAGHGGACLLSGGRPLLISTVQMVCSVQTRLVAAGGTLANIAAAALFFTCSRFVRRLPALHFLCWLSMTVNLLMAAGYFLFSGIGGFGDWAEFIKGLGPQWLLRIVLALVGAVSYLAAAQFSLLQLRPFIGSNTQTRLTRARRLMCVPYFTGGALACVAGAFNPAGWYLVALSAAASTFGGTSALVWSYHWLKDARRIPLGSEPQPPAIGRSWLWVVTASAAAIAFVIWVGPGVRFRNQG